MWMPSIPESMSRRHFLKHVAGFSLMAGASQEFLQNILAAAPSLKREHKSLIIFWMGGGPSHMDTWDLKPGQPTGGEFKPIKTKVSGVEICEHMPKIAEQIDSLAIIRSLVSNEASHERGTILMHTAYAPNPAIQFPSIGSVVCHLVTPKDLSLPGFISISRPAEGPGFLGMAYAPFTVQNPGTPPQNISPPGELANERDAMAQMRLRNRYGLLGLIEQQFVKEDRGEAAKAHLEVYQKAFDLTASKLKSVFDLTKENDGKPMDPKVREAYGNNPFGQGCLLARKLVEVGVPAIEISMGGWDNHNNIFNALHNNSAQGGLVDRLDRGMGTLIRELKERGLLKHTVLLWMGEFGRTPRINQNNGRDHWARCWSVVIGGGPIKGGQVYGATSADGMDVKDKPCTVGDLFATVYQALGIAPETQIRDPLGRPRKITGERGGKVLEGLI
ncbi:hypothetical protein HRbin36_00239 [bacterium HR36]|nr:hypothetical protein HRbin36_00239 [bacterium HR36]